MPLLRMPRSPSPQAPLLPGLLQALVVKLTVADDPAMVQVR